MGKKWKPWQTLFSWVPESLLTVTTVMKLKYACSLEGKWWQTWTVYWEQRHHFAIKGPYTVVFPVVMYGCESWTTKKAECQRIDTFDLWCWRKLLRVPWTARRSNQSILQTGRISNSTGNQSWIFIGKTDAETSVLWPPDAKSQLTGKDPDVGRDWGQEKGAVEGKMVR